MRPHTRAALVARPTHYSQGPTMRKPIPLLDRLVTIFEKLNKPPRARSASVRPGARVDAGALADMATTPRGAAAKHHGFSLTGGRPLVLRGHRVWLHKGRLHGDVAQTPSNLM